MDGKTIQVLLVEDENDHAELIRRAFRSHALQVDLTVAATLGEARRRIAAAPPHLVIADIRLPDGNGMDVLPSDGQEVSCPVVVLTAHGDEEAAVEAMKRGALDYVVKSQATLAHTPHIVQRALREWTHITERGKAEEEIENLAKFPSEDPQPVLRVGDDGPVLYANAAAQPLLDGMGSAVGEVLPSQLQAVSADALRSGEKRETDVEQDGSVFSFVVVPINEAGYVNWYGRDVTDRRRLEHALSKAHDELEQRVRERTAELAAANHQLWEEVAVRKQAEEAWRVSEERFRLAFEDGPLGMAIFSPDRRFLDANRALCDMLGYTPEELVGREIASVTHPHDRQTCLPGSQLAFNGEIPSGTWETRYLAKHGRTVWGRVTASVVRDPKGRTIYWLAMIENITERKLARERTEKLRTELAHLGRVATMGEMASGIAHELNQPLAAIVTRAEVGIRKIQLGKDQSEEHRAELLQFIADEAYRAGEIIRRMKYFMQRNEPRRTTVDIAELIDQVLALAGNDLQHAGIAVSCDVPKSLPTTLADKIQVQQVLLNLIRNALEAMNGREPDARKLSIKATARNGLLEVAVRDTGCGIPGHRMENLFEAFQGTKADGMGMGLAISRSIVEAHGGRISAAQNQDRGATFTFTLPITEEDPEE